MNYIICSVCHKKFDGETPIKVELGVGIFGYVHQGCADKAKPCAECGNPTLPGEVLCDSCARDIGTF